MNEIVGFSVTYYELLSINTKYTSMKVQFYVFDKDGSSVWFFGR